MNHMDEVGEDEGNSRNNLFSSKRKRSIPVRRFPVISNVNNGINDDSPMCLKEKSFDKQDLSVQENNVDKCESEWRLCLENDNEIEKPKIMMKFKVNKTPGDLFDNNEAEETSTKEKLILDNYKWDCTSCPAVVDTLKELKAHHENAHNQPASFKCVQCCKIYSRYRSFARHVKLHKNPKNFECEICHKKFSQKTVLLAHAAVHTDNRPHVCKHCDKSFKQFSSLYLHSKNHMSEKTKFPCPICHKEFSTKHTLESHRKIHTGERDFICDICGKSFVAKGSLDYHIISHNNVKPHVCSVCGKAFKTPRLLDKHSTLHTGIKPFHCEVCGKKFREKGALREHNRIHTGAMPYSCEFCGKAFRFKGILTVHRRQHTGERPYGCDDCNKQFTNWANYNKHMKRRHKNEYTPTNVSGRNKYKPPFLNQTKSNMENNSQNEEFSLSGNSDILNRDSVSEQNNLIILKTDTDDRLDDTRDYVNVNNRIRGNSRSSLIDKVVDNKFCLGDEIKYVDNSVVEREFNKGENFKPEFFEDEDSMKILDMTKHSQKTEFLNRNVLDNEVFGGISMTQSYVINDVHLSHPFYSSGKSSLSAHYEITHGKGLSQDDVVQVPSMAYYMPLHYGAPLEFNFLPPRIN